MARAIMPFTSALGGTTTVRYGGMTASENFEVGDPIALASSGRLVEPPENATPWLQSTMDMGLRGGIAAFGPGDSAPGAGGAAQNINPRTGVVFAVDDDIAYWPIDEGTIFYTNNFFAAAAGSLLAPVLSDIGNAYEISYATYNTNGEDTGWGIEQNAVTVGTDVQAVILDVLDAQLAPIRRSGNAGTGVTFLIVTEEN